MGIQNHPKGTIMKSSPIFAIFSLLILIVNQTFSLTVNELHGKYYQIFSRAHNRNAASHLWASYVLDRSTTFSASEIRELFGGFCPVSGSPVRPSNRNLWTNIPFKKASNPSLTESGDVLVIGDPCVHPERIPSRAPEVYCENGRLVGAT